MAERREKLSTMRKMIGGNLRKSIVEIPQASGYMKIDMTELNSLQKKLKEQGIKVASSVFFLHGIAQAMKKYPEMNSRIEGDEVIFYDDVNAGVGVDTPNGLMVVVLKKIQDMSLLETQQAFHELINKVKTNKLSMGDITGGTFTFSNLNKAKVQYFSSIINNNECLLLGAGGVFTEAAFLPDGTVVPRECCCLCINMNHALIDGLGAAKYAEYLVDVLEKPLEYFNLEGLA